LLKWREGKPTLGRNNSIEADILIIDEASMLDIELASKLFEAIPEQCSCILIGDTDQLPAIGAGSVLRDIIASHSIPVVTLDTIFRQAEQSLIIRNSHLIRKGEMPRFPETKGVKENSYVMWIPHNTNQEVNGKDDVEWVKQALTRLVTVDIPNKYPTINPIKDIQVLVPMKKNTIGSHELNKILQQALNPSGEEFAIGGKVFRVGDRVMQTRNNYDEGMEVYNGDIGFVTSYSSEDKLVEVNFYGRFVSYSSDDIGDLSLAYSQTIHKAQGSEYPIVIVVMGYQHWAMLERNLLYTANTRAKELCLYLASKGAIERAVKNNPVKERNTYLAQRIRSLMKKEEANA
jgi:exodeoxyribonuclease V alpha subunit